MILEINALMIKLETLEKLLIEYNNITNMLLSVDLEQINETDAIFSNRKEVISQMDEVRSEITRLINLQASESSSNIRKMLSGKTSSPVFSLTDEEKLLHGKILDIRSLQTDIMQKDEQSFLRFKLKREEVHSTLADLQQDKKKIDFYNTAAISAKGQAFDSQS